MYFSGCGFSLLCESLRSQRLSVIFSCLLSCQLSANGCKLLFRHSSRLSIRRQHILHRPKLRFRSSLQDPLNHFRNPQKLQPSLQERRHRHLIRRSTHTATPHPSSSPPEPNANTETAASK